MRSVRWDSCWFDRPDNNLVSLKPVLAWLARWAPWKVGIYFTIILFSIPPLQKFQHPPSSDRWGLVDDQTRRGWRWAYVKFIQRWACWKKKIKNKKEQCQQSHPSSLLLLHHYDVWCKEIFTLVNPEYIYVYIYNPFSKLPVSRLIVDRGIDEKPIKSLCPSSKWRGIPILFQAFAMP